MNWLCERRVAAVLDDERCGDRISGPPICAYLDIVAIVVPLSHGISISRAVAINADGRFIGRQWVDAIDVTGIRVVSNLLMMDERSFALGPAVVMSRLHQIHFLDVVATDVSYENVNVALIVRIERKRVRVAKAIGIDLFEHIRVRMLLANGLVAGIV